EIETRVEKFVVVKNVGSAHRLADGRETMSRRCRVDLYVLFEVELLEVRIARAAIVVHAPGLGGCVLRVERRSRAAHERGNLFEHAGQEGGFHGGLVDIADQRGELLWVAHRSSP